MVSLDPVALMQRFASSCHEMNAQPHCDFYVCDRLFRSVFDWGFQSEGEEHITSDGIYLCRGKVCKYTQAFQSADTPDNFFFFLHSDDPAKVSTDRLVSFVEGINKLVGIRS